MSEPDPTELIRFGQTLEAHQDWPLAQNIYTHFIRTDSNAVEGFKGLARVLDAQQKSDLALTALEDGWLKTKSAEIKQELVNRYNTLLEKSEPNPEETFEIAARTVECGIDLDRAISALIQHAPALKRQVEAATLLEQLLPLRPDEDLDILHACATLYHQAGNKQKARDIITYMLRR